MTRKVYKSAMGQPIDLGALLLQNEQVRAVGNMNVNARGDTLDSADRVIDQKNRQVQRQYQRTTTNVSSSAPVHSSTRVAKQASSLDVVTDPMVIDDIFSDLPGISNTITDPPTEPAVISTVDPVTAPGPVSDATIPAVGGGLAAAIARSRIIKQEKEKTVRERMQAAAAPIKKI